MNTSSLCDTQLSIDDMALDTSSSSWLDRGEDELMHLLSSDDDKNACIMAAANNGQSEAFVPDDAVVDLDSFLVESDTAGSFVTEDDSSSHFHEFDWNRADDRQEQADQAPHSSIEEHIAIMGELMKKSEHSRRLIQKLVASAKLSSPRRKSIASSCIAAASKKNSSSVTPTAVCSEDEESLSSLSMPLQVDSKSKPPPPKKRQARRNPKNLTAASFKDKSYQSTGLILRNGLSLKIKPLAEGISKSDRGDKKRVLAVAAKKQQQQARRISSTSQEEAP